MAANDMKVEIQGLTLHAKVWGNPDGIPTLAMHGWLDNAATFDHLAPLLPDHYIVAVDFPGHGFSDHLPLCQGYENTARALQMIQLVDALGWDQFAIIGHSLGGIVAQIMSAIEGKRITKLVLIDLLFFRTKPTDSIVEQLANYSEASKHVRKHTVYEKKDDAIQSRIRNNVTGELTVKAAETLVNYGLHEVPGGFSWRFDMRLLLPTDRMLTNGQGEVIVKAIQAPCLAILATNGILKLAGSFSFERRNEIKDYYHDLTVVEIQGGHHLHLDCPKQVAQAIQQFIK